VSSSHCPSRVLGASRSHPPLPFHPHSANVNTVKWVLFPGGDFRLITSWVNVSVIQTTSQETEGKCPSYVFPRSQSPVLRLTFTPSHLPSPLKSRKQQVSLMHSGPRHPDVIVPSQHQRRGLRSQKVTFTQECLSHLPFPHLRSSSPGITASPYPLLLSSSITASRGPGYIPLGWMGMTCWSCRPQRERQG
jgi:hypothetical protein